MIYNCDVCNVHCPSDYQLKQHLAGRKHATVIKYGMINKLSSTSDNGGGGGGGGGGGVCYKFQNNGFCPHGNSCTYRHIKNKSNSITNPISSGIDYNETSQVSINQSSPAPLGVCYIWWKKGTCDKGSSCTYKHNISSASTTSSELMAALSQDGTSFCKTVNEGILVSPSHLQSKRPRDKKNMVSTQFILCKTTNPDNKPDCLDGYYEKKESTGVKLASIFCNPVSVEPKKTKKAHSKFPEIYHNLFYRKRDINLLINDGLVVWEFAYNTQVIKAIKEHIKGRAWNPNMGIKGCWTAPIESLSDCIDLYEHMGRTASDELKKRATQIMKSYGYSSATDTIKLSVDIYLNTNTEKMTGSSSSNDEEENNDLSVGSINATFLYDANIVSSFKMLPPTQRSYNPASKVWTIDLFALPSLLDSVNPLGYNATTRLRNISNLSKLVDDLVHGITNQNVVNRPNKATTARKFGNDKCEVIDLTDDTSYKTEKSDGDCDGNSDSDIMFPKFPPGDVDSKSDNLKNVLKSLVRLVGEANDSNSHSPSIDISSCGTFKRQKIAESTNSYRKSSSIDNLEEDDDDKDNDDDESGYYDGILNKLDTYMKNYRIRDGPGTVRNAVPDCDCGQPRKMSGGRHTCRYFGTFHCSGCSNRWTSAYCWKGEKQACRSCNEESFPIRKDKLDGRPPRGDSTGGGHDSRRCGRCRSLGYNCSSF